jgi:peptide-methionine (S)-S-oxide reductase
MKGLVQTIGGLALSLSMMGCSNTGQQSQQNTFSMSELESMATSDTLEVATFGSGCFWCVEAVFAELKGVYKAESGYSGGEIKNPSYKEVCTGRTGHAEVVQVTFNPQQISFAELLEVFFSTHDPTTLNRQGADVGTQYRSAVFFHSPEQERLAKLAIEIGNQSGDWSSPIVTEVSPFKNFFKAEDYHQDYYALNQSQPYCQIVITPKLDKFRKKFHEKLKETAR